MTSHLLALLRLNREPAATNGLNRPSQVQVNRLLSLPTAKVGAAIGRLSDQELAEWSRLLTVVIGFA